MNASDFVSRLGAEGRPVKTSTGWQCRCPAHEDGKASLAVSDGHNGNVLIHCHAGCGTEAVVAAVGLKMVDLFPAKTASNGHAQKPRLVETYDYTDELVELLSQAVRFEPKDFRQRRPDASKPGGWNWSVKDVRPVPYRVPELISAVASGKPVFICEGEKDCDALHRAGLVATCNAAGAGKWKPDFLHAGGTPAGIVALAEAAAEWKTQTALVELLATPKQAAPEQVAQSPEVANHFKNDVGYADAFVRHHEGSIRFCADEKLWLVFDDEHGWQRDTTGRIMALAADYARERYQWALKAAAQMDPDAGKRLIASMISLGNRKRIEPALAFAEYNRAVVVRSEQLDADPFLAGAENGVINLRDGSFQPHRREHLVTRRLAVRFDAVATVPIWERFLSDVQPDLEMRSFLQRLSGYAITGGDSRSCSALPLRRWRERQGDFP